VLEVEGLGKTYLPPSRYLRPLVKVAAKEPVEALTDVSFSVGPGEIVGLVGPNGAGKTTLIKMIGTLLQPTTGRAVVDGIDVVAHPLRAKRRLGLVLADDRGLYWRLTGRQNLEFFGVIAGLTRADARRRAGEMLDVLDLADADKLVFGYSTGMRARLNIARSLLADPGLLVLDEPTRSLDPLATAQVGDLLADLAGEGRSILLSSHRLDEIASLCERLVVLVGGRCRFVGTGDQLGQGDLRQELTDLLRREQEQATR
jgi:ABC-2 type transport system ATP-binding protein